MSQSSAVPRPVTWLVGGKICAYDLSTDATDATDATDSGGELKPVLSSTPAAGDEVVGHGVFDGFGRVHYTTHNAVVCMTAEGVERWRHRLDPWTDRVHGHHPGGVLSADGRVLWVYRPNVMAERGLADQWVALDSATGAVLAQTDLETAGHGGVQLVHPTNGQVLLDVGEGQDGSVVYRGTLTGDGIDLVRHPGDDRCLIALSPDGQHVMTVDHGQGDVAVHAHPDREAVFTLSVEDFGHDPEEVCVEWGGGYLDSRTLVVALGGEPGEEEDWFRHYLVDARSGGVLGEFEGHARDAYDLFPLGDGSWLTKGRNGHPVRHRTEG
jgi:hypothetical protein